MGKVDSFGLRGIQIFEITYMSYFGKVFASLTKKINRFQRFKKFRRFRVFVLSYRANLKRRKQRKIYKTCFSSKLKGGGLIS